MSVKLSTTSQSFYLSSCHKIKMSWSGFYADIALWIQGPPILILSLEEW